MMPLCIIGLYLFDYAETTFGLGIGLQEFNPFITKLMHLFGGLAFPIAFLIIGISMYALAGQFKVYPKLVLAITLLVGGIELANVSMIMVYILRALALLR